MQRLVAPGAAAMTCLMHRLNKSYNLKSISIKIRVFNAGPSRQPPPAPRPPADPNATLPAHVCRAVVRRLAADNAWPALFAFDGKKSLYVAVRGDRPFLERAQREWDVTVREAEDVRDSMYKVNASCK